MLVEENRFFPFRKLMPKNNITRAMTPVIPILTSFFILV
jgi:hypothetical protein